MKQKNNKKPVKAFVIAIVAFVIVFAALYFLGVKSEVVLSNAICSVFFITGVWCIFDYPDNIKVKKESCTQTVSAVIVDCIVKADEECTSYYAIYKYTFNNVPYSASTRENYGRNPPKGTQAKIMINPDNPTEIYEVERERARIKSMRITGIILFVFWLIGTLGNLA